MRCAGLPRNRLACHPLLTAQLTTWGGAGARLQVALYWLNYQGREVYYRTLGAHGGEFYQPTYLSHPWVMRDKTTHMRLVNSDTNTTVVFPRVLEFTCHVGPQLPPPSTLFLLHSPRCSAA
jgi:hypothetical protein